MAETVALHSAPKESRTNSLGRAKSDCHTCSRTHQVCDRQRPRCGTCNNIGLICGGYSLNLTWKTIKSGVKSPTSLAAPTFTPNDHRDTIRPQSGQPAVPPPGRQFKFKVGKPKRPRKRPQEILPPSEGATPSGCTTNTASSPDLDFPSRRDSSKSPECAGQGYGTKAPSEVSIFDTSGRAGILDDASDLSHEEDVDDCISASSSPRTVSVSSNLQALRYLKNADISPVILFSSVAQKYSGVLQMYDEEFCIRPLTKDFALNPFRHRNDISQGSGFLMHAILALSSHHLSKATSKKQLELETETFNHKSTAYQLYREALSQPDTQHLALLDTLLVLITLEAAQSALSTWSVHLNGAYNLIKASGGIHMITTPRLTAQIIMLNWWDLTIAMIARHKPVFEEAYLEIIFSRTQEDPQTFFNLTGCPADFALIMAKLSRQAAMYEAEQRFDTIHFDYTPVKELESRLRHWRNPFDVLSEKVDNQEDPQSTRDFFHCIEAWRYALLLYILQVFGRGKESQPQSSNAYLCRLILDNTRCVRRSSTVQKQVLLPIFLAGTEAVDGTTRREVRDYCNFWSVTNGYNMFQNVGDLLERVWLDRKQYGEGGYWWGWTVDQHAQMAPGSMKVQYLLG